MFKDLYNNLSSEDKLLFNLLVDMQQLSYLMTRRNSAVIKTVKVFYDEQARQANASDPNAASVAQQVKDHKAKATESLAPSVRVLDEACEGKVKGVRGKRKPHEVSASPESESALPKLNSKK